MSVYTVLCFKSNDSLETWNSRSSITDNLSCGYKLLIHLQKILWTYETLFDLWYLLTNWEWVLKEEWKTRNGVVGILAPIYPTSSLTVTFGISLYKVTILINVRIGIVLVKSATNLPLISNFLYLKPTFVRKSKRTLFNKWKITFIWVNGLTF